MTPGSKVPSGYQWPGHSELGTDPGRGPGHAAAWQFTNMIMAAAPRRAASSESSRSDHCHCQWSRADNSYQFLINIINPCNDGPLATLRGHSARTSIYSLVLPEHRDPRGISDQPRIPRGNAVKATPKDGTDLGSVP